MSVELLVLLTGTFAAAAIDIRTRRIPNGLTAALAVAALGLRLFDGAPALFVSVAAMLVAFGLGSLAFSAGWLGGGDVKLIAAACGVVSVPGCFSLVAFILIAGGVIAIVQAARTGRLVALVRDVSTIAITRGAPQTRTPLPYGVAIAAGSAAYALSLLFSTAVVPG
jgi:prepilin peptidase CpaA